MHNKRHRSRTKHSTAFALQFYVVSCIQAKCTSNGQKSLSHTHTDRVEAKMNNLLNFSSANYASIDYGGIMRECETKNSTIQTKTKAQQPNTFTEIHIFNAPSFVRSFIRLPDYALLSVYAGLHVAIAKTDTKCKRQWKTNMLQIPKRV